jgi:hypothetical protein
MDKKTNTAKQKQCSDENPCESCPKRTISGLTAWKTVGCRRGTLGDEMHPANLCSRSYIDNSATATQSTNQGSNSCSTDHECKHKYDQNWEPDCFECAIETSWGAYYLAEDSERTLQVFMDSAPERRRDDIANASVLRSRQTTILSPVLQNMRNSHRILHNLGLDNLGMTYQLTP